MGMHESLEINWNQRSEIHAALPNDLEIKLRFPILFTKLNIEMWVDQFLEEKVFVCKSITS